MTECNRCGHKWQTKSTHVFVSCPSCYKKVKIREIKEVVGETPTEELDDLDEAEIDFVNKYKETKGNAIVLQKGVDQFGEDRVKSLIKQFIKKEEVESSPQEISTSE